MFTITYPFNEFGDIEYLTDTKEDFEHKLFHLLEEGYPVTVSFIPNDKDDND